MGISGHGREDDVSHSLLLSYDGVISLVATGRGVRFLVFPCYFTAAYQDMAAVGDSCGKKVDVAAFPEVELSAQLGYAAGEIPDGDIGLLYSCQQFSAFPLVGVAPRFYSEDAARKVGVKRVAGEEVAHGMELAYGHAAGKDVLHVGLEY